MLYAFAFKAYSFVKLKTQKTREYLFQIRNYDLEIPTEGECEAISTSLLGCLPPGQTSGVYTSGVVQTLWVGDPPASLDPRRGMVIITFEID